MKTVNLSLVICTRNRPILLNKLLDSIEKSQLKPYEVVVVSSGEEVSKTIGKYANSFKIKHLHTTLVGQSNQKKMAFDCLDKDSDWVFFLDDDLEVTPMTMTFAMNRIQEVDTKNINGIGAKLVSSTYRPNKKRMYHSWLIDFRPGGKIRKSGKATKYMFNRRIETNWLNGVSLWRKSSLINYDLPILSSSYAAYEDVIFSTKVALDSKLIYDPLIEVIEQISHSKISINLVQFKYITLWCGYFVCNQDRTRINNYKILTIGRGMLYIVRLINVKANMHLQVQLIINFVVEILKLSTNKIEARDQILIMIQNESMKSL